uniref:Uncharacterized protein n=1 Tax=viral metagenome TaxID=1070528 RepID=A0A6M3LEI7_9ZZZZ
MKILGVWNVDGFKKYDIPLEVFERERKLIDQSGFIHGIIDSKDRWVDAINYSKGLITVLEVIE